MTVVSADERTDSIAAPARAHVVITGTGRAGTTFLVQLLTHCGLETGYTAQTLKTDPVSNAGLETDIREPGAPYIVKAPQFCQYAAEVTARDDILVEHAIIPVRDIAEAAGSRVHAARRFKSVRGDNGPGGLWGTHHSANQRQILSDLLAQLIQELVAADIPMTFLHFPRFVRDRDYCRAKLLAVFPQVSPETFDAAFEATANPSLVHSFDKDEPEVSFLWRTIRRRIKRLLAGG